MHPLVKRGIRDERRVGHESREARCGEGDVHPRRPQRALEPAPPARGREEAVEREHLVCGRDDRRQLAEPRARRVDVADPQEEERRVVLAEPRDDVPLDVGELEHRLGNRVELPGGRPSVPAVPAVDDLAARDVEDGDHHRGDRPAARRERPEPAGVGPANGDPRGDAIALPDQVVDCEDVVGKRSELDEDADGASPCALGVLCELGERARVARVEDGVDQPPDECLRFILPRRAAAHLTSRAYQFGGAPPPGG